MTSCTDPARTRTPLVQSSTRLHAAEAASVLRDEASVAVDVQATVDTTGFGAGDLMSAGVRRELRLLKAAEGEERFEAGPSTGGADYDTDCPATSALNSCRFEHDGDLR